MTSCSCIQSITQSAPAKVWPCPKGYVEAAIAANAEVLITDVVMGSMSGIEAAIRILRDRPDCKIILSSGRSTTANLIKESEAQGYQFEILDKPVHPAIVLDRLAAWQRAQDGV